jgi:hypothetical protein
MNVTGPGYAGISKEMFTLSSMKQLGKILITKTSFILALIIVGIYVTYKDQKPEYQSKACLNLYIFGLLIILPQLFVYAKSGIDNHYLFPAVIGISILTVFPLSTFKFQNSKIKSIFIVCIAVIITQHIYVTYKYERGVVQETQEIGKMFEKIRNATQKNKTVIVFGNPYFHFERLFGFKTVMEKEIKDEQVYLATYGSKNTMFVLTTSGNDEQKWNYLNTKTVESWYAPNLFTSIDKSLKDKPEVIVIFSPSYLKNELSNWLKDGFNPVEYNIEKYLKIDTYVYFRK